MYNYTGNSPKANTQMSFSVEQVKQTEECHFSTLEYYSATQQKCIIDTHSLNSQENYIEWKKSISKGYIRDSMYILSWNDKITEIENGLVIPRITYEWKKRGGYGYKNRGHELVINCPMLNMAVATLIYSW